MQKTIFTLHGRENQIKNWRRLAKIAETMGLNVTTMLHRFASIIENEAQLRDVLYGELREAKEAQAEKK